MIAKMGTKEEPIFISDGESESIDENPIIMINSSSDEEDCQSYRRTIKLHIKDSPSSKLKFDERKMNSLRVSIKKLNPNALFVKRLGEPESNNHHTQAKILTNGISNAVGNISDDKEQPGQQDSEPLNENIENRTDISCGERPNATPGSNELNDHDEEGLFEKMNKLDSSGRLESQNGSPSKSRHQNIESFFTSFPNRNGTPPSSLAKTKTFNNKSNLLRQATFESLSPNKKFFTALPAKRQFQALPLTPPLYNAATLPLSGSYRGVFTEAQMNSIRALEEEKLKEPVLHLVLQYISKTRAPPSHLVFSILRKTLLRSKKAAVTALACLTLKRIHALHPRSTDMYKCGLDWNFITSIVEKMELTECSHEKRLENSVNEIQITHNASLVFAFTIYFLKKECERKMLSTSMRKCHAFKLLSLSKSFRNVRDVLYWIKAAIIYHSCSICSHRSSVISKNKTYLNAVVSRSSPNLPCPLLLIQHLLQLVMLVNEKPNACAVQLADELVSCYLGLQHLQMKIFLLQTIESHMVRSKMIDSVLQCRFPMEDCPITGLRRIVEHHFFRELNHGDIDSSEDLIKQECEEFVMLLAYLMQSYICTHEEKLQAQQDNLFEKDDNVDSDSSGLHLSVEDVLVLCDMEQHVQGLQQRLEKTCPIFSERTHIMFQLMTSLSSFTR